LFSIAYIRNCRAIAQARQARSREGPLHPRLDILAKVVRWLSDRVTLQRPTRRNHYAVGTDGAQQASRNGPDLDGAAPTNETTSLVKRSIFMDNYIDGLRDTRMRVSALSAMSSVLKSLPLSSLRSVRPCREAPPQVGAPQYRDWTSLWPNPKRKRRVLYWIMPE
jgi:hypothetical protein